MKQILIAHIVAVGLAMSASAGQPVNSPANGYFDLVEESFARAGLQIGEMEQPGHAGTRITGSDQADLVRRSFSRAGMTPPAATVNCHAALAGKTGQVSRCD